MLDLESWASGSIPTFCYWFFLFSRSKASDVNIGIIANFVSFVKTPKEDLLLLKEFYTFVDEFIEILIYSQMKIYTNHFHSVTFSPCDNKITAWNKSLLNHTLMHTSPNK